MQVVLSFIGEMIVFGGGGAAIAYLVFQFLGKSWIESKFAERLEQLRHTQALELQRLRVEIDSLLSGAIRLQEKEFQTLPEAWAKLDEAFIRVSNLAAPFQQYPDLDRLTSRQLEEFLAGTQFTETQKDELRSTPEKTNKYIELIFRYRLRDVQNSIRDLHNYVERNSIFMPPDLKKYFEKAATDLWSAMVSKQIGHEAENGKLQNEGWEKVKEDVEPLRKKIEEAIYIRLQAHGRARL